MNLDQLDRPLLADGETPPADLWALLGVTPHPVAPLPDVAWLRTHAVGELLDYLAQREETITRMREDPFNFGHEPQIWRVMDALCGFPWIDHSVAAVAAEPDARRRAAMEADRAWCRKVRVALLGKDEPVKVLLVNGGNRGSKSEWASSRVSKLLHHKRESRAWCFHQDEAMSVEYQQPLLYKYLPNELKSEKGIRRGMTYVAYKRQTGFSEGRFVLPNGADCSFRNYEQKEEKIEGGELDIIWCDELVPASWIKTLKARIATRGGWLLVTFTPVRGYTPTVKMFIDGARLTRDCIAFMLPRDGGPVREDLALAGEDVDAWLGEPGRRAQPEVPAGRHFDRVPRVMVGADPRTAVFFLHSFDNPFGNPRELVLLYANEPEDGKRMRFYGVAKKALSSQFRRFDARVHVIRPEQVPAGGTRYHVVDPCSGRNWFMIWAKVVNLPRGKTFFIYREWPSPGLYIPGVGDLGDWAVAGDKLDGERGPAQDKLSWGTKRYIAEIYRLEGRRDWEEKAEKGAEPFRFDEDDEPEHEPVRRRLRAPGEDAGQGEEIYARIMDSRYGAQPNQTREGSTTLMEFMADQGMDFVPASGGAFADDTKVHWTVLIDELLDYEEPKEGEKIDPMKAPRLYVTENCKNTIFALQNWTGADGLHGACKDPIDDVKYLVLADTEDFSAERGARDFSIQ